MKRPRTGSSVRLVNLARLLRVGDIRAEIWQNYIWPGDQPGPEGFSRGDGMWCISPEPGRVSVTRGSRKVAAQNDRTWLPRKNT